MAKTRRKKQQPGARNWPPPLCTRCGLIIGPQGKCQSKGCT